MIPLLMLIIDTVHSPIYRSSIGNDQCHKKFLGLTKKQPKIQENINRRTCPNLIMHLRVFFWYHQDMHNVKQLIWKRKPELRNIGSAYKTTHVQLSKPHEQVWTYTVKSSQHVANHRCLLIFQQSSFECNTDSDT